MTGNLYPLGGEYIETFLGLGSLYLRNPTLRGKVIRWEAWVGELENLRHFEIGQVRRVGDRMVSLCEWRLGWATLEVSRDTCARDQSDQEGFLLDRLIGPIESFLEEYSTYTLLWVNTIRPLKAAAHFGQGFAFIVPSPSKICGMLQAKGWGEDLRIGADSIRTVPADLADFSGIVQFSVSPK